ncbi:MAG: hypothetical protein U5J83_10235 [Bryobacterales bacterium]|nr:hypothetical protein [Bryobacterales bacterium]
MQLTQFRHKGLRQLYAEDSVKGIPPTMADKLRKILFTLETADDLEPGRSNANEEPAASRRPD